MASKLYNRARVTISSTGTGTLSLSTAVAGYQTFASAGAQTGDVVSYVIEDGLNWEVGTGTFNSVANTLTRTVTQSFNGTTYGTTAISVTTSAQVFISPLAADLSLNGLPGGPLNVANGGTGLTSLTAGYIPYGNGTGAFSNSANFSYNGTSLFLTGAATDGIVLRSSAGAGSGFKLYNDSSVDTAYLMNYYSGPMVFGTANTERLRIASDGSVGIGTSSPGQKLEVAGTIKSSSGTAFICQNSSATGSNAVRMINNSGSFYFGTENSAGTDYGLPAYAAFMYANYASPICFVTNGAEKMRLDASGNLGLGVTPSYKLDVGGGAGANWIRTASGGANSGAGVIIAGASNSYKNWVIACQYNLAGGLEFTQTTTAGGSTIGSTPAMALDVNGNLLCGLSNAVNGVGTSGSGRITSKAPGANGFSNFLAYSSSNDAVIAMGHDGSAGIIGTTYASTAGFTPIAFYTSGSERARIDASGNVGIGTTSPVFSGGSGVHVERAGVATYRAYNSSSAYAVEFRGGSAGAEIDARGSSPVITFQIGGGEVARVNNNGSFSACNATATPAGGSTSARLLLGTTSGFGIYYGSGAPTVSAAQGSIYLRSDGSSTSTRLYVNTNGSTTWTNVTTAA